MAARATAAIQVGLAAGQAAGGVLGVLFHSSTRDDATGRVRRRVVVRGGRVLEEVRGEEGPWGTLGCVACTMAAAALLTPLPFLYLLLAAPSVTAGRNYELLYLGVSSFFLSFFLSFWLLLLLLLLIRSA